MAEKFEWSEDVFGKSVSSRCWNYTPYEDGWNAGPSTDDELKQIVEMEYELEAVPQWAQQLVERDINYIAPCGHYLFPEPYLEAISAIGSQTVPPMIHT